MPDPSPPSSRLATLIVPAASAAPALQVGVVVIAALYLGREVLIPITLAILLSFLLAPIVELLGRAKLGRVPAVLLAVLLALGVMAGFGGVIGSQLAQLAGNIPQYSVTIEQKVDTVRAYTIGRLDRFVRQPRASGGTPGHQPNPGWSPSARGQQPGRRHPATSRPQPLRPGIRSWRSLNVISPRHCCHWPLSVSFSSSRSSFCCSERICATG